MSDSGWLQLIPDTGTCASKQVHQHDESRHNNNPGR
jgi:hypothetical protein